jgi:hypothetical protein
MPSYEYNKCHIRDPCHPRIGDQLRVKRQQPCRLLGITAGCGFPVDETTLAIELTDGVNVGNKLIGIWKVPDHLDLKILLRLGNVDSIVLGKELEQMHALTD